jgi:hypothetical protein
VVVAVTARHTLGALLVALVGALGVPAAGAPSTGPVAGSAAPLEVVPRPIDSSNQAGWWTPTDLAGDTELIAFNEHLPVDALGPAATEHTVVLGVRVAGGAWTFGCIPSGEEGGGCATFADDCGHRQPSVAIDGAGHLHAFVGMHNSPWRYYRSTVPGDPRTMVDRSAELPDPSGLVTYPVLARTPDGDVYLAARVREVGSPVNGRLYRWDVATGSWSRVAVFASQSRFWVYPDDLEVDDLGGVHVVWQWSYGGAGGLRHLGSHLRYDPSTGVFSNAQGVPVPVPATTSSPVAYQPLARGESATARLGTAVGIQSAKVAVVPGTTTPMIVYRFREVDGGPFQVRRARPTGSGWSRDLIYGGAYDTFAAIDITHNVDSVRVYYVKRNTKTIDQAHMAEKGLTGGFVEHSIAPGRTVERLSVVMDESGTDRAYLVDLAVPRALRADPRTSEDPPCPGPAGLLYVTAIDR